VQDLLVFARPRPPQLAPVPIADLLKSTAALLQRDPAYAALSIAVGGANPIVQVDGEQMKTVFLNLLLNAAQAAGGAGCVDVAIVADDLAATIAIADNGPGIPPEVRARIFEPFFTTKHRGTGLGLPTAHRVVDSHRGTIAVDCPAGGGTTVTVTLPMQ
jgi:signal transduction histidine kinase